MATTAERIREIVANELCLFVGEASDYDSLSERFHMDSLNRAEIVMALEDDLGIFLDLDMQFDTIGQLIEQVEAT
jgi:acyl carrier protein